MGLENVYKNVYQTPFYCKYQYTTLKKLNTKHGYKNIAFLFINISYIYIYNLVIIFKTKIIVLRVSRKTELRNILLRHILSDMTFRR